MLRKTVFMMSTCLVGILLFISLQVSAQTIGKDECPHLVVASHMGKVELCRFSPPENSTFNLTLKRDNEEGVTCLVYTLDTGLKVHSRTDKGQCHVEKFDGTFTLSINDLEKQHADNYICHVDIFSPPPLQNFTVNRTLLYVHDYHMKPPACDILSFVETWVLIGVSVLLFACFLAVLIMMSSKRKQCRECDARNMELTKEQNSEYMHMASVPLGKCRAN
ncbi:inducible T-cell costimulator-like [Anomaloglossus baeobatrachus]|uniref:inducible T-cell costimulator-like n=1 Tax=Anomaloglossus baeobatrachus TaxID=238106 RepID=UPI003F4F7220